MEPGVGTAGETGESHVAMSSVMKVICVRTGPAALATCLPNTFFSGTVAFNPGKILIASLLFPVGEQLTCQSELWRQALPPGSCPHGSCQTPALLLPTGCPLSTTPLQHCCAAELCAFLTRAEASLCFHLQGSQMWLTLGESLVSQWLHLSGVLESPTPCCVSSCGEAEISRECLT